MTGSVPTGVAIATAAAKNVVPCVIELGGKSAAIVRDDADLGAFESDVRWGIDQPEFGPTMCAMVSELQSDRAADMVVARKAKGHSLPRVAAK
ncbi:aldehyde dehydrogenase family protein [Sulfitobacter aestuariivivens]|uniref:aldehyde dehydrogenase family protein n=1 Tax=Sulfitobacter aestuariivivens TaxID=2766981 RepID=UPI0036090357